MIGGAPVNDSFARKIGADYYTPDAATAADVAKKAVLERAHDKRQRQPAGSFLWKHMRKEDLYG